MASVLETVSGTFTATGTSDDTKVGAAGLLILSFAGTATVQLEVYSDAAAAFVATGDVFTKTGVYKIDLKNLRTRLNCTAYTDDVIYELRPNREGNFRL